MSFTILGKTKEFLQTILGRLGFELIVTGHKGHITIYNGFPKDMDERFKEIYDECKAYTTTSIERMYALYKAVEYIIHKQIPGDFAECGVWRGGSTMIMAHTLLKAQQNATRNIYLYDTFAGMTKPTEKDVCISDASPALNTWKKMQKKNYNTWAYSPLDEVKTNMFMTGYPEDNIILVKGKVEDTIPGTVPERIALLRLDTDWYESTYHELQYLFPLLSHGGVLIIDDSGHFSGAKEAVDTYLKENNITLLLNRIDYTGRIGIKF